MEKVLQGITDMHQIRAVLHQVGAGNFQVGVGLRPARFFNYGGSRTLHYDCVGHFHFNDLTD